MPKFRHHNCRNIPDEQAEGQSGQMTFKSFQETKMRSTGVAGLHLPERAGWLRARHLMDMESLEGKKLVVQSMNERCI